MATTKKAISKTMTKKNTGTSKTVDADTNVSPNSDRKSILYTAKRFVTRVKTRFQDFLSRRPHRSFRPTKRRDYVRILRLPGYWSFTNSVRKTLVTNKRLFIGLAIFYGLLTLTLIGIASQTAYTTLGESLRTTGSSIFSGNWGAITQAGALLGAGIGGGYNNPLTETQQVYAVIIVLLTWLTTVWLLRATLAGARPKLREGLYGSSSPIVSTFIVLLVVTVQLLPVALAASGVVAATTTGLLSNGGIEVMAFWAVISLLFALSLYWITSTLIALVIVTLPGMYPMKAIKVAGDLIMGRRIRVLLRLVWLAFTVALGWAIIMVPVILFDAWLKGLVASISWLPIVPVFMLVLTSITVIWVASYIYLLYRRIVDDDTAAA